MTEPTIGTDDCEHCELSHILGWEEDASNTMAKKRLFGRCCPTPAPEEAYSRTPRIIKITARMSKTDKECIESLYTDCCEDWHELRDREGELIDYVWMEEPAFRWDSELGCGDEPWIGTLTLVCSST